MPLFSRLTSGVQYSWQSSPFWKVSICCFLVCVSVVYVYSGALNNGFVWDDIFFFVEDSTYTSADGVANALTQPLSLYKSFYRPLVSLSFSVTADSPETTAELQHAMSIGLHAALVAAAFLLAHSLAYRLNSESTPNEFVTAGVFSSAIVAFHPTALEPVVWISGRFDLLLALWATLLLWVIARFRRSITREISIAVLYFLAAASKETAVALPLVVLLLHLLLHRMSPERSYGDLLFRNASVYLAMLCGGGAYIALRFWALGELTDLSSSAALASNLGDRIRYSIGAFWLFMKLLALPWLTVSAVHPVQDHTFANAESTALAGVGVLLLICFAAYRCVISKRLWPIPFFAALVMLLPVLHLLPLPTTGNIAADRYAFPALAMMAPLGIPIAFARLNRPPFLRAHRIMILSILAIVVVASIVFARGSIPVWHSELSLWRYSYSKAPDSPIVANNYSNALIQNGAFDLAEQVLEKSRANDSTFSARMRANLALLILRRGNAKEANQLLLPLSDADLNRYSAIDQSYFFCARARVAVATKDPERALHFARRSTALSNGLSACRELVDALER